MCEKVDALRQIFRTLSEPGIYDHNGESEFRAHPSRGRLSALDSDMGVHTRVRVGSFDVWLHREITATGIVHASLAGSVDDGIGFVLRNCG
jgi:hypothetical protein